jgi:hypothetical protein
MPQVPIQREKTTHMPQMADWKTLSISLVLLFGLCCPKAHAHSPLAFAARTSKASASSDADECLPHCRSNYTCVRGQCVTECNPPCADNESCNQGECVAAKATKAAAATSSSDEQRPTDSKEAQGEETAGKNSGTESSTPPAAKGARVHDGFYLRMSFGFGALLGSWSPAALPYSPAVSSFAEHYELALGGTPFPGLVIGGGLFGAIAGSPMYGWTSRGSNINIPGGSIYSEIIGPFVDVYPKPARGIHFMAALGPAGINQSSGGAEKICYPNPTPSCSVGGTPVTPYGAVGVGFVMGFGYEAFVADHWSIGGIVRIMYTYGNLSPNDRAEPDAKLSSFMPGLMFGATFQ